MLKTGEFAQSDLDVWLPNIYCAVISTLCMALMLAVPTTAKFTALFYNHCSEAIEVECTAHPGRTMGKRLVQPGASVSNDLEPQACPDVANEPIEKCGGATFLLRKPGQSDSLAAEYGNRLDWDGVRRMWYNWSSDAGNPFLDRKRSIVAGAGCPRIDCAAGSDACNHKNIGITSCAPDPYYVEVHVC